MKWAGCAVGVIVGGVLGLMLAAVVILAALFA
jgi:hypothetical protein